MVVAKSRPRRTPLDAEAIAAAALELIDKDGLAALSARRLAAALHCEAMSLYHHVDGMEGVLDVVVERMIAGLPTRYPRDPRKALGAQLDAYLALADAHPNAFVLIATRRIRAPSIVKRVGEMLAALEALGLSARAALREVRVLVAYANGAGLALAAWRASAESGADVFAGTPVAALAPAANAQAVRADLRAGLERLIERIGR